jgi:23S rRNA (cytosine1962-C5)-methyltransferase
MTNAKIFLRKKVGARIVEGHPWIYGNEIGDEEMSYLPGDIVDVYTSSGSFVGKGYINPNSQIKIRLLSRNVDELIDEDFFRKRILASWNYRQKLGYSDNCRVVFGESDELPGLVVDKINDYLIIQLLTLGIDKRKNIIVQILMDIFNPKGIYERDDVYVRELEGLPLFKGNIVGNVPDEILLEENGLKFYVDVIEGQKTGYFLDHYENRVSIERVVQNANVLDAFSYTGTFSIYAAKFGAKSVLGLDLSEKAIKLAQRNAEINGFADICKFEQLNAFDILKQWSKEGRKFDTIILDPPPFTKNRSNIEKALVGYKEINLRAMKLIENGGFIITTCCTNLISTEMFLSIIHDAAKDAKKKVKQISLQSQSADHPILWNVPEMHYLKFLIISVQ